MTAALRLWFGLTALAPAVPRWLAARAHKRQGADPGRFNERLGIASAARKDGLLVWFHAASLGEAASIKGVARDLQTRAGATILVTTATATGAAWVAREMPFATHQFVPIDSADAVERFFSHWHPNLGVFVEGELWPRLILGAVARNIPLALVNARISRSRRRMPKTTAELLSHFSLVTCQSEGIGEELRGLGISPGLVHVTGDLKAAAAPLDADPAKLKEVENQVGARPVWVAASTHPGDENPILTAHRRAKERGGDILLILVPRHAARADHIRVAAISQGLVVAQRSRGEAVTPNTSIYLADTIGELGIFYRIGRVVFLGGSFGAEGGHNPFEPAILGAAILTGPNYRHFEAAFSGLAAAGGARIVAGEAELGEAALRLLSDEEARDAMGRAARSYVERQAASGAATVQLLNSLLASA
jgi:3-deoxy-D-manno-octulosonic-acid transferase